ncbi:hypothetical protein [Chitinimonas lacunae]|uniref:Lipoprotein n=1 Tax=Chitinimonas lacunae TaxID=1963018 RepID=A0ABV8MN06_9NEIS
MKTLSLLLGAALLGGCANLHNESLLDGRREFGRADMHLYPVKVVAIDGKSVISDDPVRAEAGERRLKLITAPVGGFYLPPEKVVPFTIAPCKRYYLAARRDSPLQQDFELVVQDVEPLAGCDTQAP